MRKILLLNGFMGAGKSTVGPLVAERAGLPFVDLDARIAEREGLSVAAIFAERGEAAFRAAEGACLAELLDRGEPSVVALGGGSLVDAALRRDALERACVVTLEVDVATALARAARDAELRPLLATPAPDRRARELLEQRASAYAEAHARVPTAGRTPSAIAADVLTAWRADRLVVPLGARSYSVAIEDEPFVAVADAVHALAPSSTLVVTDRNVDALYGERLARVLAARGLASRAEAVLEPGEEHKQLGAVERALRRFVEAGADRSAVVLAMGGGVVTDVGGFVAATLLRGVRWVAAPTTLLGMVDAAVGGKTGVDVGPAKNAAGAFHQPSAVVAGAALVATETERAYRSGLAEVVKAAAIGDPELLTSLESRADAVLARDRGVVRAIVRRAVGVKARIVSRDEREAGERLHLNFGHTVGHALEAHGGYVRLTHGEAVSLGMVAALRVGRALGVTAAEDAERLEALLARFGLPTALDDEPLSEALALVTLDKKRLGGRVRFVLLRRFGAPEVHVVAPADLGALLARGG